MPERDYRKIIIPLLNSSKINERVCLFRKKIGSVSVPVEIEDIIEIDLRIDIIPIPSLQKLCDTDALITSDWKSILVDNERFSDDRYKNRLRFSLAHEIGHFVLHKDIYESFKIKSSNDFYRFIAEIPQDKYGYLETQANKFASHLLLPRDRLLIEKNRLIKKDAQVLKNIDKKTINSYLAVPVSKIFGVSEKAAEIALNDIDGLVM
ncbi:MAG: ImmA/IrrE family metallo-endopeptidase [Candidatus Paceibacterota bacterium]|jgi:hypothetical protein